MSDKDKAIEILRELVESAIPTGSHVFTGPGDTTMQLRRVIRVRRLYDEAGEILARIDKKKAAREQKNATD